MNAVELVKQTCKERGISIAKLERDCDFSNGYIGKLKKGVFPVDKAQKISEYLGIDLNLLIGVQQDVQPEEYYNDNEAAQIAQQMYEDRQLHSLFHVKQNLDTDRFQTFYDMIIALYRKEHPEDDYDFDHGEQTDRPYDV